MYILAFETSCDDTSVAIFKDSELLFMDTASQIKIHNTTWWVVPEVAAREHANAIFWVLDNVLNKINTSPLTPLLKGEGNSKLSLEEIDYIAVTMTPGLIPSLLTGITVARSLSNILKIPFIEINHIEAHIFANFIERKREDINYPLVCLTVSWWHNEIYFMKDMWSFDKLGWTTDDAAWEAFDKVAKMMWLGYPWGPIISKLAGKYETSAKSLSWILTPSQEQGATKKDLFPRVWLAKKEFNFSFSWLKSAVKREIDKRESEKWELTIEDKREIAYEFENAVTEVLAYKLLYAWEEKRVKTVMLAWWVSANDKLNNLIREGSEKKWLDFISPTKKIYSMDNAAMVWMNAYYKVIDGRSFELKNKRED